MKKLTAALLSLGLLLCGCKDKNITEIHQVHTVSGEDVIINAPDTAYTGQAVHAIATYPVTSSATDENGNLFFTQSYQKFQFFLNNNQTQSKIEADLQMQMDQFFRNAGTIQAQAQKDCRSENWSPYYAKILHTPTRVDDTVISLCVTEETYYGVEPVGSISTMNYDAATGDILYLGGILTPACSGSTLASIVLRQMVGTEGLNEDYASTVSALLRNDIDGFSSWYLDQQGLCIFFAPDLVSPDVHTVVIPYGLLTGMLQEKFLPSTGSAKGSLAAQIYSQEDESKFSFIANVELDANGTAVVIYPNDKIHNLRVECGTLAQDGTTYNADATVFASDTFHQGNALVIRTSTDEKAPVLRISYFSEGQTLSAYVLYNNEDDSILLAYG